MTSNAENDDSLYDINEDVQDAFDLPPHEEAVEDKPTYQKDEQNEDEDDDENDEEYDPSRSPDHAPVNTIDDSESTHQETIQTVETQTVDPRASQSSNSSQPSKDTEEANQSEIVSKEEKEAEADEEEEEASDYDLEEGLNTTTDTKPTEETSEQAQDQHNQEDEEDDYDPTSELSTPQTTTKVETTPSTTNSTVSSSNELPAGIDASITQKLTAALFSDPEFVKLSYADQQKRVLEEFTKLQQTSQPGDHRPDFDSPMALNERELYNTFLDNETKYNSRYPFKANSRLFVGNLPANFNKESIYRLFHKYGKLLQISIKNTYAFLQFDNSSSVEAAIKAEHGIPLQGKDLVLEVAKNSRPETIQQNIQPYTERRGHSIEPAHHDRKRGREGKDSHYDERSSKSRKQAGSSGLECQIFVKQNADPNFAREVFRLFENAGIRTEYEFLKSGQNLDSQINDAAYSGVLSVVLINRNRTVDVFIYEQTSDGGIRFDEYISINTNDASQLLTRAKNKKGGQNNSGSYNRSNSNNRSSNSYNSPNSFNNTTPYNSTSSYNPAASYNPATSYQPQPQVQPQQPLLPQTDLLQSLQNLPPQALQNLLTLAQAQQPQYQQPQQPTFYQPQQPAPQATNLGGVDLAALLGKLQPVQQQPVPQPQQQQSYGGYNPANAYQPSTTSQYISSQVQQSQPSPSAPAGGSNVQALLDTLSKLQK